MMRGEANDRTRLSWWFPKLPSDISVPKTHIIPFHLWGEDNDRDVLINLCDGKKPEVFDDLCERIKISGNSFGWPLFLRTDYTSGKHNWKDTCFVQKPEAVAKHVYKIVEFSVMADLFGLPTDCWIAREIIPTTSSFVAFHGNMPIVKERRYFVRDDQVVCHHPYWPEEAFKKRQVSTYDWRKCLDEMNIESQDEVDLLSELSVKVGKKIGGFWSIDWLWSEPRQAWFLTDMAEAEVSYHWPGCENVFDNGH